jgi:hypothetical protein
MITGTASLTREWQVVHQARSPGQVPGDALVTVEQLRERLSDAADTLRRLPKPKGLERSLQSPWPDTLREWLSYGYDRTQVRRAAPAPQAIDRLDEVLEWIGPQYLTASQRMILWAREGEHFRWARIEMLDRQMHRGQPRKTRQLQNIKSDAEARILSRLNGTPGRMRLVFPGGG